MEKFNGIPLIKTLKNTFSYNFLMGDFGKEVLKEYNYIVKSKYKDNPILKVLNFKDGLVTGTNNYAIFPMNNKILSKYGLRTMNPSDVQKVINNDNKFLRGVYADLGGVLRDENGANEYLAEQLAKQSKDRKYKFSNSNPLVFKPSDLDLIVDNNAPHGLRFKIRESATPFNAPELSNKNNDKEFGNTNKNGIPIFDKNGNRTNYATDNGLSRFLLGRDLLLDSGVDNLTLSGCGGRIVVIDDGGKEIK